LDNAIKKLKNFIFYHLSNLWISNPEWFSLSSLPILVEEINNTSTSIQSLSNENYVKIFPNPTNSDIKIINTQNYQFDFELYDITGKMVLRTILKPMENKIIPINGISKGVCIYKIKSKGIEYQEGKVIIE
jgi:hypothetical protein